MTARRISDCPCPTLHCMGCEIGQSVFYKGPIKTPTIPSVAIDRASSRELQRVANQINKTRKDRDEAILKARANGASLREIALQLGVSHVTVRTILQNLDEGKQTPEP